MVPPQEILNFQKGFDKKNAQYQYKLISKRYSSNVCFHKKKMKDEELDEVFIVFTGCNHINKDMDRNCFEITDNVITNVTTNTIN